MAAETYRLSLAGIRDPEDRANAILSAVKRAKARLGQPVTVVLADESLSFNVSVVQADGLAVRRVVRRAGERLMVDLSAEA
jgi:hypothetical protein